MALYRWIAECPDREQLQGSVVEPLIALGLQVQPALCSESQLYAKDPDDGGQPIMARVTVLLSRLSRGGSEWQVEVRSSESMARLSTRCALVAEALQRLLPESFGLVQGGPMDLPETSGRA